MLSSATKHVAAVTGTGFALMGAIVENLPHLAAAAAVISGFAAGFYYLTHAAIAIRNHFKK